MGTKLSYYTGIPENIFTYAGPEESSSNYHFFRRINHTICVDFITTPFHKNIDRKFQYSNSLNKLGTEQG